MKFYPITGLLSSALVKALADFEAPFTYPLGPGKFFRITHGEDYTLFFRAMGNEACFIAEEARGRMVLLRLARAAEAWLRPRVDAGFGVVMNGTVRTPEAYTGRCGIPVFQDLGQLVVFRISVSDACAKYNPGGFQTSAEAGLACYRTLSVGRYACPAGQAEQRSLINPVWLMSPDGSACGMLEDTRKAKRLITGDGSELLSAHLSCFAYSTVAMAAELIRVALRQVACLGFPALFVAVVESDAQELREALRPLEVLAAPATVYGTGLMAGSWSINSSEI
jgi:hypothetical protein